MVFSVKDRHSDVDDRMACQCAPMHGLDHPFFNCRDVLTRNGPAHYFVHEFKALATAERFKLQPGYSELTAARLARYPLPNTIAASQCLIDAVRRSKAAYRG